MTKPKSSFIEALHRKMDAELAKLAAMHELWFFSEPTEKETAMAVDKKLPENPVLDPSEPEFLGRAVIQGLTQERDAVGPGASAVVAALERVEKRCALFESLLREWRRTPFFEDPGDWEAWVRDFRPKVDEALGEDR